MDRRSSGKSAPYGRACMDCFKAKCKCITRPGGNDCERCHRLRKQCRPSDSLRRRNALKTQDSSSRIAQLEGKLDSLVSLLQTATGSSESSDNLRQLLNENGSLGFGTMQQDSRGPAALVMTPNSASDTLTNSPTAGILDQDAVSTSPPAFDANVPLDSCPPVDSSNGERETCLELFRSWMLPQLPFIHLPSNVTVQQLRQERPILLDAIVAVASPATYQKKARGAILKLVLTHNSIMRNESNVDLLLALLTYATWGFDSFLKRSGTLSRLMMLGMSLVYDMRWNKPLPRDTHMIGPFSPEFSANPKDPSAQNEQLLKERQRGVLACFMLSSVISNYYGQIEPMRWTARMEEYLQSISNNEDCPSDKTFAHQVRLQLLAHRASQMRDADEVTDPSSIPHHFYLQALKRQLQELRESPTPPIHPPGIIEAQAHYIDLCINQAAHPFDPTTPIIPTPSINSGGVVSGFGRLKCLWNSVTSIASFLDVFLKLPPSAYIGFTLPFYAQLARCLVIMYRLSIYEDPLWDLRTIRSTVDLLEVLDQICERLELASIEVGVRPKDDIFLQFLRLIRVFRAYAASKIGPEVGRDQEWPGNSGNGDLRTNDQILMESIDFESDGWLDQVLAGFN